MYFQCFICFIIFTFYFFILFEISLETGFDEATHTNLGPIIIGFVIVIFYFSLAMGRFNFIEQRVFFLPRVVIYICTFLNFNEFLLFA